MSIRFYPETRLFVLDAADCTYAFMVHPRYERLVHLYYGAKLDGHEALKLFNYDTSPRSQSTIPAGGNPQDGSLSNMPQEFSSFGCGDFRRPSAKVMTADGFDAVDAKYVSHKIVKGKPKLAGLPASFADETEAETLEVTLRDEVINVEFVLSYSVFEKLPVIARSVRAFNRGEKAVTVETLASLTLDWRFGAVMDLVYFPGGWVRERHPVRERVLTGIRDLAGNRGLTGHQMNPFFILCDSDAGETHGRAWGQMLVYSGNFAIAVERDQYDMVHTQLGLNPERFSWKLEPGEEFQTPEALTAFSASGLETLSHTFHDFMRNHVIRQEYVRRHRPVVVNNWESTKFAFDEARIIDFARRAAALGMDMMVLDDGWFGHRDESDSSLGDWVVYKKKLPSGIAALADKIRRLGVEFGLWFEPEMVSPDSDLYRAHPDWCLHIPGRPSTLGRNQLVLDMGRPEVVDCIFAQMDAVIREAKIKYIKWDANRQFTEVGSGVLPADRQGEAAHRFVLGTYSLLERLLAAHPELFIEGCAAGGGRFDAGMLYYTPQIWTSDDTDAVERLCIQYGTSFGYPPSAMSCHVSDVPNRHVGRVTPFATRGDVAMMGAFGYELDLAKLSDEEISEVRRQIAVAREDEELMLEGDFFRLGSPLTDNLSGWQVVAKDKRAFTVTAVRIFSRPNPSHERIRLRGLDAGTVYRDVDSGECFSGAFLMNVGMYCPIVKADFTSFRRRFRAEGVGSEC